MSVVTQISGSDPRILWTLGALPLGLALDFALGDLPGRSYPIQGLRWLIEVIEEGVRRTIARLGGGRGGDLFGGLILTIMVVGTTSSVVWLVVDVADRIGGLATLLVRAALIAAGVVMRASGDRILCAVEAAHKDSAGRWLAEVVGRRPGRLNDLDVPRLCAATVGEVTLSGIIAPLFWLGIGGPSALWGYLAIRILRETIPSTGPRSEIASRIINSLMDLAEAIPARLSWILIAGASGLVRANATRAWRVGWEAGQAHRRSLLAWPQGTLAGALGVQMAGGRVFEATKSGEQYLVGPSIHTIDQIMVVRAVRIMQVAALLMASGTALVSIIW